MNGYDNLDIFAEVDHEDLNALNILDSESRTKLITAAELLADYDGKCVMYSAFNHTFRLLTLKFAAQNHLY